MGKKIVFYLDPSNRKNNQEELEVTFEELFQMVMEFKKDKLAFEGTYFAQDRKLIEWYNLPDYCPECLERLYYEEEYDSIYCKTCDEWRETSCDDPTCEYCAKRPNKPSES